MIVNIRGRAQEVVETFQVTSNFGAWEKPLRDHAHLGQDFAMEIGTELHPLMDGVVSKIVDQGAEGLGKGIYIRMENGDTAIYGHLSEVKVQVGEMVDPSDVIGLSGSTGASTGGHLHLGIKDPSGAFKDPAPEYAETVQSWDPDIQAPADLITQIPDIPDPVDVVMNGLGKVRDAATEQGSEWTRDAVIWLLDALKDAGIYLGKFVILIGPDAAIVMSMIFCIGAICSVGKAGKWTVSSLITGIVLEIVRKVMMIG